MNGWILFQLLVDIALFAIVIVYIIRESGSRRGRRGVENEMETLDAENSEGRVDTEQLESLMDELAKLIIRAEKAADRIEKGIQAGLADAEPKPARGKTAMSVSDDAYSKAARLIKKGLLDEEIGRRVGLPAHEISLIRNMAT